MADMAEDAEAPVDGVDTDCIRALDRLETGSALLVGQRPRDLGFFVVDQVDPPPDSPFICDEEFVVCDEGAADTVVVDDACDDKEEDEFVLCTLFRGMNILETSSELIP